MNHLSFIKKIDKKGDLLQILCILCQWSSYINIGTHVKSGKDLVGYTMLMFTAVFRAINW